MKLAIFFAFLILGSQNIYAEDIVWGKVQVGEKDVTYPTQIVGKLVSENEPNEAECLDLDKKLVSLERVALKCRNEKDKKKWCDILKNTFTATMAHEYNAVLEARWRVFNDQNQKAFPAGTGGIDFITDKILGLDDSNLIITYGNGSVAANFGSLADFGDDFKVNLKDGKLWTLSRYAACDLKRGKIKVEAKFKRTIEYTNKVSPEVIDFSWNTYSLILKNREIFNEDKEDTLIQAALIGSTIAMSIEKSKFSTKHKEISIKNLFLSFVDFDRDTNELKLKVFSSKNEFQQNLYPSIPVRVDVDVLWSNQ